MTDKLRDAISGSQQWGKGFEQFRHITRAELINIDGNVNVSGRPGWVWVREYGENGGVFQVFNPAVQSAPGLPVLIGRSPKLGHRRVIISVDWELLPQMAGYTGDPYLPNHADSHEWREGGDVGADAVSVYVRAWVPLRVYPESALTISIAPGRYMNNNQSVQFAGQIGLDISSDQPGVGLARYVLIYLDKSTNTIDTSAGNTAPDAPAATPPGVTMPDDSIALAYVRLDGDATTIVENDIVDLRTMWSGDSSAFDSIMSQLAAIEGYLTHLVSKHLAGEG